MKISWEEEMTDLKCILIGVFFTSLAFPWFFVAYAFVAWSRIIDYQASIWCPVSIWSYNTLLPNSTTSSLMSSWGSLSDRMWNRYCKLLFDTNMCWIIFHIHDGNFGKGGYLQEEMVIWKVGIKQRCHFGHL